MHVKNMSQNCSRSPFLDETMRTEVAYLLVFVFVVRRHIENTSCNVLFIM